MRQGTQYNPECATEVGEWRLQTPLAGKIRARTLAGFVLALETPNKTVIMDATGYGNHVHQRALQAAEFIKLHAKTANVYYKFNVIRREFRFENNSRIVIITEREQALGFDRECSVVFDEASELEGVF